VTEKILETQAERLSFYDFTAPLEQGGPVDTMIRIQAPSLDLSTAPPVASASTTPIQTQVPSETDGSKVCVIS
jgi:hypothetical protein